MRDVRRLNPVRSKIMSEISMREMLEAGVHFGHQTRYWNPKMAAYLYGHRNKIHIIDLEKTKVLLQEALNFVGKLSANKGTILFVGTKRAAQQIIREEAQRCGMPYINLRWLGGLLTNYKTVKQSINRLKELEEMKTGGGMERMSKKEILHFERELEKLDRNLSGIKDMDGWPDALFVIDVGYEDIAVSEAAKLKIPVIGIVDSNNSPMGVDYVIPGNDDAIRSIRLYTQAVADAILTGKDSVAHLGEGGDKDDFVELDAEGAPIAESKREKAQAKEKVQVKKKTPRKSSRKTASAAVDGGEETEAVARPETKPDGPEVEAGSAEPAATDGGKEEKGALQPGTQAEEAVATESQTGTGGGAEVSRDNLIYECVRQVPRGKVATYGRIAELVGAGCSAQQVGQVMRHLPDDSDVPWQRIIGSKGEIKPRSGQKGDTEQRRLLEQEGVVVSDSDKVDLVQYGMSGTDFKSVPKNTTDAEQE